MHRDRRLVVEGHPLLPGPGSVLVRVGPLCEGLAPGTPGGLRLGVWPGHGLQCGGLGGVVGDRRLVEDVDAGVGFCRCRFLGTGSWGGGACPALDPSGVEEADDALSFRCLAVPLLGLG